MDDYPEICNGPSYRACTDCTYSLLCPRSCADKGDDDYVDG